MRRTGGGRDAGRRRRPGAVLAGALLALLGQAVGAPGAGVPARIPAVPVAVDFERRAWPIMGTLLEIGVRHPAGGERGTTEALRAAYREVVRVDRLMSLYRDDSELTELNRRAGDGPVEVSRDLLTVLRAARRFGDLTGGAFDVTVQPLIDLWGFYFEEGEGVPSPAAIEAARDRVGYRKVRLHPERGAVSLEAGTSVDLGAIAKGYAVDLAIAELRRRGVAASTVDLGGNVGVLGDPSGGDGWPIGVRHPRAPRHLLGTLRIAAGAVATSGDYERFFVHEGRRYAHIVDPRTGWPVQGIFGVTVAAPDGMTADALTTGAFVMGRHEGLAKLVECRGVEGVLVVPGSPGGEPGTGADASGSRGAGDDSTAGDREGRAVEPVEVWLTPGLATAAPPTFEPAPGTVVRTAQATGDAAPRPCTGVAG